MTKTITLKGTVAGMLSMTPNSFIILAAETGKAEKEYWTVEGNSSAVLLKSGLVLGRGTPQPPTIRIGDEVTVMAYLPKPNAKVKDGAALVDVVTGLPPQLVDLVKASRLAHGTDLILRNGKKFTFGQK